MSYKIERLNTETINIISEVIKHLDSIISTMSNTEQLCIRDTIDMQMYITELNELLELYKECYLYDKHSLPEDAIKLSIEYTDLMFNVKRTKDWLMYHIRNREDKEK